MVLHEQYLLLFSMLLVGIAWASILSMPYAMLSNAIPAEKMGFYMGVFNFFIVLPQILASVGTWSAHDACAGRESHECGGTGWVFDDRGGVMRGFCVEACG